MKRWLILLLFLSFFVGSTFAQLGDIELSNTITWADYAVDYPDGWTAVESDEGVTLMNTAFIFVFIAEMDTSVSIESRVAEFYGFMNDVDVATNEVETMTVEGEELAYYAQASAVVDLVAIKVLDEGLIGYVFLMSSQTGAAMEVDESLAILASLRLINGDESATEPEESDDADSALSGLLGSVGAQDEDEEQAEESDSPLDGIFGNNDEEAVDPSTLELSGTPEEICEAATPAIEPETREYSKAAIVLEKDVDYLAIFCTDAGVILVDLFEEDTPLTVNNFVFLAQNNYYNNTIFHRVIEDFMAQGGDPTGTGRGGPGYQFEDEIVDELIFDRPGLLAMANAGANTNGSQFFITFVETDWLNGSHTIFGEVVEGLDVLDDILLRDPQVSSAEATTLETVVIITDPDVLE